MLDWGALGSPSGSGVGSFPRSRDKTRRRRSTQVPSISVSSLNAGWTHCSQAAHVHPAPRRSHSAGQWLRRYARRLEIYYPLVSDELLNDGGSLTFKHASLLSLSWAGT